MGPTRSLVQNCCLWSTNWYVFPFPHRNQRYILVKIWIVFLHHLSNFNTIFLVIHLSIQPQLILSFALLSRFTRMIYNAFLHPKIFLKHFIISKKWNLTLRKKLQGFGQTFQCQIDCWEKMYKLCSQDLYTHQLIVYYVQQKID